MRDYYFISDDRFYLAGLQEIFNTVTSPVRVFFINAGDDAVIRQFRPSPGDVVIIAVDNLRLRRGLMKQSTLGWCRLFLLPDVPVSGISRGTFPVILPRRVRPEVLLSHLRSASVTDFDCDFRYGSELGNMLFHGLSRGNSVSEMAKIFGVPAKYLYQLGRNIRREYGLDECNISGLLICQEILEMKAYRKVSRGVYSGVTASRNNNRKRAGLKVK